MNLRSFSLIFGNLLLIFRGLGAETRQEYINKRNAFVKMEKSDLIGGKLTFTDKEKAVNKFLMASKIREMDYAKNNDTVFPPATHFFQAKSYIDKSQVFHIIKKMPKGAVLHTHDSSMVDLHWVIQRATYDPHCYMSNDSKGPITFHFFDKPPTPNKTGPLWQPVMEIRRKYTNMTEFDEMLYRAMTLIVPNPQEAYKTQDKIWQRFRSLFKTVGGLFTYTPVFKDYFTEAMKEFHMDNVQYVEIRAMLPSLYDLDGTIHGPDWVLDTMVNLTDSFRKQNPDFIGAKVIYTSIRSQDKTVIRKAIQDSIKYLKKYPDFFAGYDLVEQEDHGHSLLYFLDDLLYPSQHGIPLKYFFHAGETDWEGLTVDENLISAILLNTTRIGHGYALSKHPEVMKKVMQQKIPIEVNPISNQVLMLVSDLRNHPMSSLMAQDYPLVISPDDPALWGARGLSYDFYEVFMGLGGAWADLATLKQLAINSIRYSAMSYSEQKTAMQLWEKKWTAFIQQIIYIYDLE